MLKLFFVTVFALPIAILPGVLSGNDGLFPAVPDATETHGITPAGLMDYDACSEIVLPLGFRGDLLTQHSAEALRDAAHAQAGCGSLQGVAMTLHGEVAPDMELANRRSLELSAHLDALGLSDLDVITASTTDDAAILRGQAGLLRIVSVPSQS